MSKKGIGGGGEEERSVRGRGHRAREPQRRGSRTNLLNPIMITHSKNAEVSHKVQRPRGGETWHTVVVEQVGRRT